MGSKLKIWANAALSITPGERAQTIQALLRFPPLGYIRSLQSPDSQGDPARRIGRDNSIPHLTAHAAMGRWRSGHGPISAGARASALPHRHAKSGSDRYQIAI